MASVTDLGGGKRAVQFFDHNRVRRTIRLGKLTSAQAKQCAERIDALVSARRVLVVIDSDTIRWLSGIPADIHAKLAALDLCAPRVVDTPPAKPKLTLGHFLASYIANRQDVKHATKLNYEQTKANLVAFFGTDKPIEDITAGDAQDFSRYLKTSARAGKAGAQPTGLEAGTVNTRLTTAKQFFADAVSREQLAKNPFSGIKRGPKVNRTKDYFVTRAVTQQVMDACPDVEWRALIALSRFGGLRCNSETRVLRWTDVDWERGRILVTSPKTASYGKSTRVVPLFPELREVLSEAWEQAEPGAEYVINRYRGTGTNVRTQFERIIRKAGIEPWPKPWMNCRASRATELAEHYPSHVAAQWLGHTERVADAHYRQTTEEHFTNAALHSTGPAPKSAEGALHKALQSGSISSNQQRAVDSLAVFGEPETLAKLNESRETLTMSVSSC